jgi:hypothetical protein
MEKRRAIAKDTGEVGHREGQAGERPERRMDKRKTRENNRQDEVNRKE